MKLAWITALIPLAACGRADFDPVPAAVLECAAAPPSFQLADNVQEIASASTTNGYAVFTTDDKGAVTGTIFELSPTDPTHTLVEGAPVPGLASGADNRQIGAFASGDDIELAVPDGPAAAPTGFTRIPLTAALAANGAAASTTGWTAQAGSIAYSSAGIGVYLQQTTGANSPTVEATTKATPDAAPSAPVTLKQGADQVFGATIIALGDKFLLTWITNNTGDVFAQVLTADLAPASGTLQITTAANNGAKMARAAFANGEYMFVWTRKDQTGADQAWFSLLDAQQATLAGAMLSPDANIGSVVAGGADFLVAWQGQAALSAARIGFDGTVHDAPLTSDGGAPINGDGFIAAWDLVSHNGQPALIWGEAAPAGTRNLWIDPLCAPQPAQP